LGICGAEGKPLISLKQTEYSLKYFATRMRRPNYSEFNKWKKVSVAGVLEKKHRSIIQGLNRLKQLPDGILHCVMVVADCLATFVTWLPMVNIDTAEWIHWQWVEKILWKCACKIQEVRKKGRRCNTRPATDVGECGGQKVRCNLPELPNTTFTVMIHWLSNRKDMVQAPKQLQASYTD
jgi:hypothetical protein